ncbi:MAG: acyl-CoA dehydrogenase family protein [Thermodesulfobacteriota bacterium]
MEGLKYPKGGEFLIDLISPREIFTPEEFTEEQRLIAKAAAEFAVGEIQPWMEEIEAQKEGLLPSLLRKAGELGFLSGDVPEEYGGQALDQVSVTLMTEKLTPGGGSFMASYGVHAGVGSLPIIFFGNRDQKTRYLPRLATGEMIGAYALTEPESGSDSLSGKTAATLSPDGKYYVLNGQKQFITNAGFADLFVTYAKVDGNQFTSFIVERKFEGVSVGEEENKMGIRGSSTRSVVFTDAKVPVENVLGKVGRGHVVAFNSLNIGRLKLAGGCVGSTKIALQNAVTYAKQRVQFGRPIAAFGLIKHKIAEMAIGVFMLESMVYRTAALVDGILQRIDQRAGDAGIQMANGIEEYAIEDSINKVYSSEMMDHIVDEALQIYGGYGYVHDYPMEQHYRDSRISRIVEGTNEINRLLIVDMLMRRNMKNRLPVLEAAQKAGDELLMHLSTIEIEDDGKLNLQKVIVETAKKVALFVAGAAVQNYMSKLADEEEILALISDMVIEIFAMESGLLRAWKTMEKAGDERFQLQIAMISVYVDDAFERVAGFARRILSAIASGNPLRTHLSVLEKASHFTPINTVVLRRGIADAVIKAGRYPFDIA